MNLKRRCPQCESDGPHETTTKGQLAQPYDVVNTTACACGYSANTAVFSIHALLHKHGKMQSLMIEMAKAAESLLHKAEMLRVKAENVARLSESEP